MEQTNDSLTVVYKGHIIAVQHMPGADRPFTAAVIDPLGNLRVVGKPRLMAACALMDGERAVEAMLAEDREPERFE